MITRTWAAFRKEGIGLIGTRTARFARKALGHQNLMVYRMPPGVPAFAQRHQLVEIELGTVPTDPTPWGKAEVEARLTSGSRLFALRAGPRLVSFMWMSRQKTFHVDEIRRDLKSETTLIWLWDAVTPTEYRGHGYYPEMLSHLAARLGQRDVVVFVRTDNRASVRGITKAGFQPWMEIAVTRWWARLGHRGAFDGGLTISS